VLYRCSANTVAQTLEKTLVSGNVYVTSLVVRLLQVACVYRLQYVEARLSTQVAPEFNNSVLVFGRPFLKRFALCWPIRPLSCPVCLWRWCIVAKRPHGSRCHLVQGRPRPRRHCVRCQLPPLKSGTAPNFRPVSIVAKWSPISATAEHLLVKAQITYLTSDCIVTSLRIGAYGCPYHLRYLSTYSNRACLPRKGAHRPTPESPEQCTYLHSVRKEE